MTVHDLKTCPQALLEAYIPSKFWFKHFLVHGPYLNLLQVTPEIKDASKAVFSAAKGKGLINQQTLQQMCLGWGLLWLSSHWELLLQKMHQFTPKKKSPPLDESQASCWFSFFFRTFTSNFATKSASIYMANPPISETGISSGIPFSSESVGQASYRSSTGHARIDGTSWNPKWIGVTYARWKWKTYGCFRK